LLAAGAALAGGNVLAILLAAGGAAILREWFKRRRAAGGAAIFSGLKSMMAPVPAVAAAAPIALSSLFLVFLKFGAVIFGSGYVLLAFLQADLVQRRHWLTQAQLLDAVAEGQVTPGPVFTTATFIGYVLRGVPGAIGATVGIFLPGFIFVAISRPLIPRIRRSALAGAFLDGVNAGAVALMIAVTWQLSRAALIDVPTAILAAASAAILIYYRINSAWLVGAGGLAGLTAARWLGQ
jgi:chromate transporter